MPTSQNGWSANDTSLTESILIPGTVRSIRLRKGDAGFLLAHFAAWFDKNVESIDNDGEFDDWGYAERPVRGSSTTLSNHASGTAIDLNAPEHPLGVRGTFSAADAAKIRAQLRTYDGAIRWGGDYSGRPDEMHFEINANAETVARVAARIREGDDDMKPEDFDRLESMLDRFAGRIEKAIDSQKLDIGKQFKWADDRVAKTVVEGMQESLDTLQRVREGNVELRKKLDAIGEAINAAARDGSRGRGSS